jgi:glycosidase
MRSLLLLLTAIIIQLTVRGQLLSSAPQFIRENSAGVEITMDASKGNKGLFNYANTSDVYVHLGVITTASNTPTDWKYVKFASFNTPNPAAQTTYLSDNKWRFTITGDLRGFFGVTNNNEKILKIAILFRSGDGNTVQRNADGTDMYIPVYEAGLQVRINQPFRQPTFIPIVEPLTLRVGDPVTISTVSSIPSNMVVTLNGTSVGSQNGTTTLNVVTPVNTGGEQKLVVTATDGGTTAKDSLVFFVDVPPTVAPVPAGVRDGINYESGDTSVILVFYAPGKNNAYVLGDFNNWTQSVSYQMNKTPDGQRHWIRITGLVPGTEYAYQFLVDGNLRVADYYAEKVLDPNNDRFIPASTYPNLKPYPATKTQGIVSVLQTAKPPYAWQVNNFVRPDKRNIVIYELLLRDFLAQPNWKTLKDTLSYIKRLGANVIHVMPFSEFEGNISWGYNPSFMFAADKYYGTENDLKAFIDECHKQGIAVVMDMVLNHAFGQSPMVQLYFDAATGKPAANSPWFNTDPKHPFNVGYDFNHESASTIDYVNRVVEHWLTKYKLDGFRWDLSKGFTQVNNINNVNEWGKYDASRIAIWKRIFQQMQAAAPGSYCILEHFADNNEEKELSAEGMLLWGNMNGNFNEATMGYVAGSNLDGALHTKRGWDQPHLIAYQESHDEERLMYKNIRFGNSSGSYSTRNLATALKRNGAAAAFWAMMPGPKLLWQFGELGYDFSITRCPNGTVPEPYPDQQCRTDPKPIRWDYKDDPNRAELYNVYSALINLRLTSNYASTFTGSNISSDLVSGFKWMVVQSDSLRVVVIGNFDVAPRTGSVTFPQAGPWYSYLSNNVRNATGSAENITLQPGEYFVYTNRNISNPVITSIDDIRPDFTDRALFIYPNPVGSNSVMVYEIPQTGRVNVSIWNMQGQRLGTLNAGIRPRGRHQVNLDHPSFNLGRAPAGNYVLVLEVDGKTMKKQFVLNR